MVSGSILAVWAPDEGNRGDELPRMGKREPCHLLGRYCARALGSAGREMSRLRSRGSHSFDFLAVLGLIAKFRLQLLGRDVYFALACVLRHAYIKAGGQQELRGTTAASQGARSAPSEVASASKTLAQLHHFNSRVLPSPYLSLIQSIYLNYFLRPAELDISTESLASLGLAGKRGAQAPRR